ncbi:MAG: glutamine--tRNA ligase/YqeY domain fusion protein [Betaproteobacteria bacterium]|nr:glutamine--tRNA ligase/YqeY domain fusion protein [Betaproteobacteria bacterium]
MSLKAENSSKAAAATNFVRNIVEEDLRTGKYASRRWGGRPGPAAAHAGAPADPARIRTRFPPEPNGYLHIGHAKSILLNFGLARDYGGLCHMRFDDTNPTKEEQEYVDSILDAVRWLGGDWGEHLYYASDYFETLYRFAEMFIEHGLAYVESLSADELRALRGTLTEGGENSPYRDRPPAESLDLFRRMRAGEFPDGAHVLRLKIDMASGNINMRDPVIYRIRHAHHHRTGDAWCIYPMYDYTHCISDALENITHSICTLEFEDHRPLYDWVLERLADFGALARPLPRQIEFARLNLTYVVLSKRKLIQLVEDGHVEGWDDPRLPTIVGFRRRGYTPESLQLFAERIGVAKENSTIDMSILEDCLREDLNERAPRRIAVLDPVKLVIDNYPEGSEEQCQAPNHPQKPEWGQRAIPFSRELWIEREDFMENPSKGYFRLSPGAEVRLRYAYIVKCERVEKDASGNVAVIHCSYDPASKSSQGQLPDPGRAGASGAEKKKVKGNIHWLSAQHAAAGKVRLYDRLFRVSNPGAGSVEFLAEINPDSKSSISAWLEPALTEAKPEERFQFERHGYFVADLKDSKAGAPVFNRAVTLRDSWGKAGS